MSESKTVQIRDMDPQLWRQVKSRAAHLGLSVKDYVASVLSAHLAKHAEPEAVNAPNEVRP